MSREGGREPGYDDVRRHLVERGYLDGRIERFVVGDLSTGAHRARRLAMTAAKAAVLGAPLLGALLAGAAVAANQPRVGPRDAAVLWLYLSVVSAIALFVLDLAAAGVAAAVARRRRAHGGHAVRAGVVVGIGVAGYLVLWWWRRGSDVPVATDLGLAVAAIACTAVVVRLARLVSLAGLVGGGIPVRERAGRGLALLLAATVPVLAIVFLLPRSDPASGVPPSPFEVEPADGTVWVVGIDGLDAELAERLAEREVIPWIAAATESGATFRTRSPSGRPPIEVWTTIATGVEAREHGVRSVGGERLPGVGARLRTEGGPLPVSAALRLLLPTRGVPLSGADRGTPALWEVVSRARRVAAVGWWASWPAESVDGGGYVVTDRVLAKLLSGGEADRDTAPEGLFPVLGDGFAETRDGLRSAFAERFEGIPPEPGTALWEAFLLDGFYLEVAGRLAEDPDVRVGFVYLPGLDLLRTDLAREGGITPGSPEMLRAQDLLERYAHWVDAGIARLTEGAERVVWIADPGRAAPPAAEGILGLAGPDVPPGCRGGSVDLTAIAPVVLGASRLPTSRELPGRVPDACVAPGWSPRGAVETFGRRADAGRGADSDFDPEMLERLRSLGYL